MVAPTIEKNTLPKNLIIASRREKRKEKRKTVGVGASTTLKHDTMILKGSPRGELDADVCKANSIRSCMQTER
jgi:hypothetical protein